MGYVKPEVADVQTASRVPTVFLKRTLGDHRNAIRNTVAASTIRAMVYRSGECLAVP